MAAPKKTLGLGRGLDALISTAPAEVVVDKTGVVEVDINKIEPSKEQPRKYFDEDRLQELAESMQAFGIIQPLIVKEENGYFRIIAGERRFRAARIAKLTTIPVIIKDYSETEMIQLALIENIQRQDLNPIEEALCYKRLIEEFFFTQESLSTRVGKNRNTISYMLSLLHLDERVQHLIIENRITAAHGRALLQVKDADTQFELSERVIEDSLNTRDLEKLIQAYQEPKEEKSVVEKTEKPVYTHVESDLKSILGTQVKIVDGKNKGKIEIEYYSPDDLDRLLGMFRKIDG